MGYVVYQARTALLRCTPDPCMRTDGMKALRLQGTNSTLVPRPAIQVREEAQHMEYIAFDAHKKYTMASVEDRGGRILSDVRVPHRRETIGQVWAQCATRSRRS